MNHTHAFRAAAAALLLLAGMAPVSAQSGGDFPIQLPNAIPSNVVRGVGNCPAGATVIYDTTHASTSGAEITAAANGAATCMGDRVVVIDHTLPICEITVEVFTLAAVTPFDLTLEVYTDCTTSGAAGSACGTGTGTLIPSSTTTVTGITPPALGTIFAVTFPVNSADISGEVDNTITVKLNASRSDVFWRIGETPAIGALPAGDPATSFVERCGSSAANNGCARNFGVNNNFAMTITGAPAPSADVTISKSDSQDPVTGGSNFSYLLDVANAGPDAASNVTVSDTLPANVSFVSASGTGWTCNEAAGTVTCTMPSLAVGPAAPITITVTAADVTALVSNTATVSADEPDPSTGNNTASEDTNLVAASADLSITKTDSVDPVVAGSNFDYVLSVSNAGPDAATNVVVTDVLPAGVSFVSASGTGWTCNEAAGTVTCSLPTLAVGPAAPITITVTAPLVAGALSNTASVSATQADPNGANGASTQGTTIAAAFEPGVPVPSLGALAAILLALGVVGTLFLQRRRDSV